MKLWSILILLALIGTTTGQHSVKIEDINADKENVTIKNYGPDAVQMEGWILCDCKSCHKENDKVNITWRDRVYTFKNYLLLANATLLVCSYKNEDNLLKGYFYWNRRNETDSNTDQNIWNNGGDTAYLLNSTKGIVVDTKSYGDGGDCNN